MVITYDTLLLNHTHMLIFFRALRKFITGIYNLSLLLSITGSSQLEDGVAAVWLSSASGTSNTISPAGVCVAEDGWLTVKNVFLA